MIRVCVGDHRSIRPRDVGPEGLQPEFNRSVDTQAVGVSI